MVFCAPLESSLLARLAWPWPSLTGVGTCRLASEKGSKHALLLKALQPVASTLQCAAWGIQASYFPDADPQKVEKEKRRISLIKRHSWCECFSFGARGCDAEKHQQASGLLYGCQVDFQLTRLE